MNQYIQKQVLNFQFIKVKQNMGEKNNTRNGQYLLNNRYQYSINSILGKGATGIVYKGFDRTSKTNVAIKVIQTGKMPKIQKNLVQSEKKALSLLNHPNVMKAIDIIQDASTTNIISQIYDGGSLKQYLQANGPMKQKEALEMFRKIVTGYCSVVQANVIHRDLKTANILLTKDNRPVIIDFGYCQIIIANTNLTVFNVGSPSYMSPQAYNKTIFSQKSDIWSLGAIFYQLLTGFTLDKDIPIKKYFQQIQKNLFPSINFNLFETATQQILKGCLASKSEKRITAYKIKYLLDKQVIGKYLSCKNIMTRQSSVQDRTTNISSSGQLIQFSKKNDSILQNQRTIKKQQIVPSFKQIVSLKSSKEEETEKGVFHNKKIGITSEIQNKNPYDYGQKNYQSTVRIQRPKPNQYQNSNNTSTLTYQISCSSFYNINPIPQLQSSQPQSYQKQVQDINTNSYKKIYKNNQLNEVYQCRNIEPLKSYNFQQRNLQKQQSFWPTPIHQPFNTKNYRYNHINNYNNTNQVTKVNQASNYNKIISSNQAANFHQETNIDQVINPNRVVNANKVNQQNYIGDINNKNQIYPNYQNQTYRGSFTQVNHKDNNFVRGTNKIEIIQFPKYQNKKQISKMNHNERQYPTYTEHLIRYDNRVNSISQSQHMKNQSTLIYQPKRQNNQPYQQICMNMNANRTFGGIRKVI